MSLCLALASPDLVEAATTGKPVLRAGVATAAAAYLCKKHDTTPRGVYQKHLAELQDIVFERGEHANDLRAPGEQRGTNDTTPKPIKSKGAKR